MISDKFAQHYDFALDTFQQEAIDCLLKGQSVLVTAPTGSGKTVIAEFAIFDAIDRNLRVIYTTPLKALSNQKYRDLVEFYGEDLVGLVTGDIAVNSMAAVVVMTTEILRNILYQDLSRLDEVLYVVIDECHYMNDEDRGTVWEEIIIHAPSHIQLVALSATIANADELAAWISSIHTDVQVIEHLERPVPLRYHYYAESKLMAMYTPAGKPSKRVSQVQSPARQERSRGGRGGRRGNQTPPIDIVEALDKNQMLPAIYFIFSRMGCDLALEECLRAKPNLNTKAESNQLRTEIQQLLSLNPSLKETGPSTENLLAALPFGIATHHAGLVPVLRHFVEVLFQQNLIKVVFATETLAAGINMPARTTVINSLSKRTDVGHRVLTVNEFTQMTGRAGRRGKDIEGFCVVVHDGYQSPYAAYSLIQGAYDPIGSHFSLSYNMVLNLLNNFNTHQIRTILQKSFGQYLSNKEIINLRMGLEKKKEELEQADFTEHKYVRYLRKQIRKLQKNIEYQQERYIESFMNFQKVLVHFRRLETSARQVQLTPLGKLTSHIRSRNELLISLVVESIDFSELSAIESAIVLSTLIFEPRRYMYQDMSPCSRKVKQVFNQVFHVAADLQYVQEQHSIALPVTVEVGFAPIVALWGNGSRWSTLFKFTEMADGDIVRAMRQLIDLLHQLNVAPEVPLELRDKLPDAIKALDRDLIKVIL